MLNDRKSIAEDEATMLKLDPAKFSSELNDSAIGRAKAEDYKAAFDLFAKALSYNPDNGNVYQNRGTMRWRLKDMNGACEDWNKAVELGSKPAMKYVRKYCEKNRL